MIQDSCDKFCITELFLGNKFFDRGTGALIVFLELRAYRPATKNMARDKREKLKILWVDGLWIMRLGQLERGVIKAIRSGKPCGVKNPAWAEERSSERWLYGHGNGEKDVRRRELADVNTVLEKSL